VQSVSSKATELQRAILLQRLGPRFTDLRGCVAAVRSDLERLVDTSRRVRPVCSIASIVGAGAEGSETCIPEGFILSRSLLRPWVRASGGRPLHRADAERWTEPRTSVGLA
jgi:hypothetical protein